MLFTELFFLNSDTKITQFIGGTGVTEVAATLPLSSSSPSGPSTTLSISQASTSSNGFLSSTDFTTFNSKLSGVNTIAPLLNNGANPVTLTIADSGVTPGSYTYANLTVSNVGLISAASSNTPVTSATAGTGISLSAGTGNITITNSAPDQTVTLTAGTNISISGSYPNFTINSTASGTDRCILTSGANTPGSNSYEYMSFSYGNTVGTRTLLSEVNTPVPQAGTISRLFVAIASTLGVPRQFTLFKNNVATSLTCTVAAGNTGANDTVNTVSVVAGDLIAMGSRDLIGGGTSRLTLITVVFTF